MLLHNFIFKHHTLNKFNIDSYAIVQNLYCNDCKAKESLWHHFHGVSTNLCGIGWAFELLPMSQQQSRNHLHNSEEFCVLYHKEIVLSDFRIALICWSIPCIIANGLCNRLNKRNALEQVHWNLAIHLTHIKCHWIVNYWKFGFNFLHQRTTDQNLNETLFGRNAFKRCFMFDMQRYQPKQLRQKRNTKENLGWSVHAPVK